MSTYRKIENHFKSILADPGLSESERSSMAELYKADLHRYSLLTEAELLVQFEKDYDYPVSEIQLPPGFYDLEVTVRFEFNDVIQPEFMIEMFEQAEYVVMALARKEFERNSGEEKWIKNAEYFVKVLQTLHLDVDATM